ncbi:MAG: hypothetical protein ACKOQM_08665 [Novosphingobium sp.]
MSFPVERLLWGGLFAAMVLSTSLCEKAEPNSPIGAANGTFTNSCCGDIELLDGRMIIAGQQVAYSIDKDKSGTFIGTDGYVGASSSGFVIRPKSASLKIYLDQSYHPQEIILFGEDASDGKYSFRRVEDR